jgi:hypothetical protein
MIGGKCRAIDDGKIALHSIDARLLATGLLTINSSREEKWQAR